MDTQSLNMQTLKLHHDRTVDVLLGSKTNTIRSGLRAIEPGPLLIETTEGTIPAFEVDVDRNVIKTFRDLTEEDVLRSGHDFIVDLVCSLLAIYPDLEPASTISVIEFTFDDQNPGVAEALQALPESF